MKIGKIVRYNDKYMQIIGAVDTYEIGQMKGGIKKIKKTPDRALVEWSDGSQQMVLLQYLEVID